MADIFPVGVGEFADFMPESVDIYPYSSTSVSGVVTYGSTPTTIQCRVELRNRIVKDRNGRDVVSRGRVFLNTTTPPGISDRIVLPAGYVPREPPIIAVNPCNDELGTHHVTLDIG